MRHDELPPQTRIDLLLRSWTPSARERRLVECAECVDARESTFCLSCKGIWRCTHCVRCTDCTNCTRCTDSSQMHECSFCERSHDCLRSTWLTACRGCSDCVYCFGCVGLQGREFHIFNEAVSRKEYFERVPALREALGLPEKI